MRGARCCAPRMRADMRHEIESLISPSFWRMAQSASQSDSAHGVRSPDDIMENLLKKLDLTSLRLFVAVCQEQNIARAAEREFIVPSAVSRRISEIEAMVGLPVI